MQYERLEDAELVGFIQAGDERAFAALVARHARMFHRVAYRVTLNMQDAEDTVQECFLSLWSKAEKYRANKAAFTTWFYTIVTRRAIDAVRRRQAEEARRYSYHREEALTGSTAPAPTIQRERQFDELEAALTELPEQQRAALSLFYFGGMKQKAIAATLNTTPKAVESLIARARENLRARLPHLRDEEETQYDTGT